MKRTRRQEQTRLDLFDAALLLAEGQARAESPQGQNRPNWADFIENLSRISNDFAQARAEKEQLHTAMISAPSSTAIEMSAD